MNDPMADEAQDEADWQQMGLASFAKDWDNPDDAIYDNWRELYKDAGKTSQGEEPEIG